MKVMRHARHADRVMRIEGTLAVAGVGSGILLWIEAGHFGGYGFAAAAFLGLGSIQSGIRALRNYNRYQRGSEGEEAALASLKTLPDSYTAITNFVPPGTRQGDTDLLVLGPAGVLVVEVKAYSGHYGCSGDTWFQIGTDGERLPLRSSLSRQLKRNRKAIGHYLVDCDVAAPIHAVAVFKPGVQLELDRPTVPVIGQEGLRDFILHLPPAPRPFLAAELEPLFAPEPPAYSLRLPARKNSLPPASSC